MTGTENDVDGALRTGIISGHNFVNRAVQYYDVDGIALFEGDINLGTTDEVEAQTAACRVANAEPGGMQNVTTDSDLRWPNGIVPFDIADGFPNKQAVHDAIAHLHSRTPIKIEPRTSEADHVRFVHHPTINDSHVGRRGGEQLIRLKADATDGVVLHELMHCLGAWHEHSRADRDAWVEILWENIRPGKEANFTQHLNDNEDVGAYDYGSIMHYPRDAFGIDGRDTIVPQHPHGVQMGQRERLSDLDIQALRSMYPRLAWPATSGGAAKGLNDDLWESKAPFNDPLIDRNLAIKRAVDEPLKPLIGDNNPYKRFPDDDPGFLLEPDILFARRGRVPFALATEDADAGNPPSPGQVTPTLLVQLEKVLGTLTWANAARALSQADKECWAGTAAVYARLVASHARRAQ